MVRTRIDWKYLLCPDLTDAGFDHTALREFRTRLLAYGAEDRLFDAVLELARHGQDSRDECHLATLSRPIRFAVLAAFGGMRNVLAHAGRSGRRGVSAVIATAFAHDDAEATRLQ